MGIELENLKMGNVIEKSINSINQDTYSAVIKGRGIDSATISYRAFRFGVLEDESPGQVYRKFFYNSDGRITKKFEFDADGKIVAKEESTFVKTGNYWDIEQTTIFTAEDTFVENYEYENVKGKHKLKRYTFLNPKWPRPKEDIYEYDKFGRINKRVSYGLMGEPELITNYLYDTDKDTKVSYRHVTLPDEELVITLLYTYDSKKQKQTGLYSFFLTPDQIIELRRFDKENWGFKSMSQSHWEYDAHGHNTGFYRDEMLSRELELGLNLLKDPAKNISPEKSLRVLIEKNTSDYEKINDKFYLVRTTEWLTRINEPLKAVKQYRYFNSDGQVIDQHPASEAKKRGK